MLDVTPNSTRQFRFYTRTADGSAIYGFDTLAEAKTAALEYGDGTQIVDTRAQTYFPMLQSVRDGEVMISGVGGWGAGRMSLERDCIEAIKKGHVAIVHAFLAKGADANGRDGGGGPALHWAIGGGKTDIVLLLLEHGADRNTVDGKGQSALELAKTRGRVEILEMLEGPRDKD